MIGELLDKKYRIVRELGRGGMGAVFEAKHTSTGRRVAVKGVVHRDIKPANLFLTRGDDGEITVKILDFGIAKIKPDGKATDDETTGLTRTGSLIGSPQCMSPEQARGIKDIDHRTDLWSLGVVLYRALTGRTPNDGIVALGELIISLCSLSPAPVEDAAPWVGTDVAAVVHGALQIRQPSRYQSAVEMLAAIRAVLPGNLALRRVSVVIVPADAAVEVGGGRMAAQNGIVAIQGALGNTHRVRLFKGKDEIVEEVAITETGALPAKLELVEATTPTKTTGSKPPAASSGAARPPASGARAGNPIASGAGTSKAAPPHGSPPTVPTGPADPLVPKSFE